MKFEERARLSMDNQAIDNLFNKLELLEQQYETDDLSYKDYSSSKDDVINDLHSILSKYSCPDEFYL